MLLYTYSDFCSDQKQAQIGRYQQPEILVVLSVRGIMNFFS